MKVTTAEDKTMTVSSRDLALLLGEIVDPAPAIKNEPEPEEARAYAPCPEGVEAFDLLVAVLANHCSSLHHDSLACEIAGRSVPLAQRYLDVFHAHRTERARSLYSATGYKEPPKKVSDLLEEIIKVYENGGTSVRGCAGHEMAISMLEEANSISTSTRSA